MKKSLLILFGTLAMVGCANSGLPNPFICETESQTALKAEVNAAPNTFDRKKLNYAVHIGDVQVSANNFATNADFNGLLATALSRADLPNAVVVIDTSVNACNPIQDAYIKYIISQVKAYGIKTDKVVFVDAANGRLLKADSKVATIDFGFYVLPREDVYGKEDSFF